MNKVSLTIAFLTISTLTYAEGRTKTFSTLESTEVYEGKYAPVKTPVTMSKEGIIYQTGRYDMPVMIGDTFLDNIATSSFIAAEDVAGTDLWAVGLKGAARITACTTDLESHLYVAGIFADDLVVGSTDFAEQVLTGSNDTHEMSSAFVAKYNREGQLLGLLLIDMKKNKAIPSDNDAYVFDGAFTPGSIVYSDGRVYLSATYAGTFEVGNISQNSSYINGMGALFDATALCVLSFDAASMAEPRLELDMNNTVMQGALDSGPRSITLATDQNGGEVYAAIVATDKTTLTIGSQTMQIELGTDEFASVLVQINKAEANILGTTRGDRYWYANEVNAMQIQNGKVFLAGTFSCPLAFAGDSVPDLWCDQWQSCIDLSTHTVLWSLCTGAKRDDMPDTDSKYRYSTMASYDWRNNAWTSIGSVLIASQNEGKSVQILQDNTWLGICGTEMATLFTTLTPDGSKLLIDDEIHHSVAPLSSDPESSNPIFDLSGRRVLHMQKGIYIQDGKLLLR